MKLISKTALVGCALSVSGAFAHGTTESTDPTHIIEVKVSKREERTRLADLGYALEDLRSDRVFIWGQAQDAERIRKEGFETKTVEMPMRIMHDPRITDTTLYHSYDRMNEDLAALEKKNPSIVTLVSLGRSVQNRNIPMLRISGKSLAEAESEKLPVAFYVGCHHAREHLSVEVPYMFAEYLIENYGKNKDVTRLVDSREIYVAPMLNPDGHVYDFQSDGRGRMWRKNRSRNSDGSYGVDLNRNYGYKWGTGGSSADPRSETFKGPKPFSEPETQALRDFVDSQPRMTTLLTLHTFSELVLYPWGHSYDAIGEKDGEPEDAKVFKKMAEDIAAWNHYTPEQASELYIASGDTTDWAYGTHRIIAFTFELTPTSMGEGGFYPGDDAIQPTFQANIKPMMYLLEYADNPRRVLNANARRPSFLETPSKKGVALADYRDAL